MKHRLEERLAVRVYRRNGNEWIDELLDIKIDDGIVESVMFYVHKDMFETRYQYVCHEKWIDGLAATLESIILDNVIIDMRTGVVDRFEYSVSTVYEEDEETIRSLGIKSGLDEPDLEEEDEDLEDASIA